MFRFFLFVFLFQISTTLLIGQVRDSISEFGTDELIHEEMDTSHIFYFYSDNPYNQYSFTDTLLDDRFVQYDPTRVGSLGQFNLGNLGSAHHSLLYDAYNREGFDVGLHQYDLYKRKQLKYYVVETPYSEAYFSQGPKQEDSYFKGNVSRNFSGGLNFSMNYSRINNLGLYRRQKSRNTALALGMWLHRPRYDGFLTYNNNVIQQHDNGGITSDTSFMDDLNDQRENIPVHLLTANTRHTDKSVSLVQHLKLRKATDSTGVSTKRNFRITHQFKYQTLTYKFDDEGVTDTEDTLFYKNYLVDSRGLRHFIKSNSVTNYFGLATFKPKDNDNNGPTQDRDNLEVGLRHRVHFVGQEPEDTRTINNLMLTGKVSFQPSEKFNITANGHFCLWDNAGDYLVNGLMGIDLGNAGKLGVSLKQQRYAPSLVQQKFYVSQQKIWDQGFTKPIESKLSASYTIPFIDVEVDGNYHLINNPIYFDTTATPLQFNGAVNLVQLLVKKNFHIWKLHLENTIAIQTATEDVIRVPNFYTNNRLYYQGMVFKNVMLLKTGFELRMASNYYVPSYSPLVGQFHLQDDREVKLYPAVDFFLAFQVTRFRGFFKIENATSYLTDDIYFPVQNQPLFEQNVRFGISWRFSG